MHAVCMITLKLNQSKDKGLQNKNDTGFLDGLVSLWYMYKAIIRLNSVLILHYGIAHSSC